MVSFYIDKLISIIGNKKLSNSEIEKACNYARADEFIEQLPDSYNTIIGERGFKLSGGQRQRIGIARALYQNSQILVFDEATSALDNKTEDDVIQSLKTLNSDLTIIMIAHRLSTIENCDKLIEVKDSKIREI